MSIKLESVVDVAKNVFKTPSLAEASIELIETGLVVNSVWSQLDLEKNERTRFQRTLVFDTQKQVKLVHSGRSVPVRNNTWNVKSPNGVYTAVVTSWKDGGEEKQFLEIWKKETRVENINLTKLEKHGNVYEKSDMIGSLVWSSDSKKLVYLAEAKKPTKDKSFFVAKLKSETNESSNEKSSDSSDLTRLNEYCDDWGEQLVGKSKSVLVVYDIQTSTFDVLDENIFPADYFVAKADWFESKGLLLTAYYTKPYKLGLIYCPVRKSELFYLDLSQKSLNQMTNFNDCARDARFSPNGEYICWLQNSARMPHCQASKLVIMKWNSKEIDTLIDVIGSAKENSFPGLFTHSLPTNCWSADSKRVIINTTWRSETTIISVDVDTKQVTRLNTGLTQELHSLSALAVNQDWICANYQSYTHSASLLLAKLPARGQESSISWTRIVETSGDFSSLADVELIKFVPSAVSTEYPDLDFEAILVRSKVSPAKSLIVYPHGGPHSAFKSDFSYHDAIFYSLGYSVLFINYRGSAGFGQNSIDSLPGKISDLDVKDCQQAAEFVKNKYGFRDVVVQGGSHGGFLTLQLIGQYPEFYRAAATRNPVADLNSMYNITDIPDWTVCEALAINDYDPKFKIDFESYQNLISRSPIKHIDNIKTPTLLMIGGVDLRVPPSQGIEFYKGLLSRNVPAKLLVYKEDNHPLDKPQTFADTIVHMVLWFEKYTSSA